MDLIENRSEIANRFVTGGRRMRMGIVKQYNLFFSKNSIRRLIKNA